ncbi:MAG: hypothetical protein WC071_13860, partial [Victivallaceae bacterium]
MKCLINCRVKHSEWSRKYFYGINPYMLKIANKPLLEYFVEFCALSGVKEIRFVMEDSDTSVESFFQEGGKWDLKITYSTS